MSLGCVDDVGDATSRDDAEERRRHARDTRRRRDEANDASGYFAFRSTLALARSNAREAHESDNDELRAWSAMAMRAMATTTTTATTAAVRWRGHRRAQCARKKHAFVRVTERRLRSPRSREVRRSVGAIAISGSDRRPPEKRHG